ncbi:hypothetical protein ACSS6W_000411 [Trichoderma asperelloides]
MSVYLFSLGQRSFQMTKSFNRSSRAADPDWTRPWLATGSDGGSDRGGVGGVGIIVIMEVDDDDAIGHWAGSQGPGTQATGAENENKQQKIKQGGMHFRPVEQSMDDDYLGQGGGGGPGDATAPEEAGSGSGGMYFSLDDVFGPESESVSASGDGAALPTTGGGTAAAVVTSLDRPESPRHPSDMRRLEAEHATAGYREGISAAKEQTVQAGFDEGFSLGATIGLAAGQLLGMLEGIDDALKNRLGGQAGGEDGECTTAATATSELLTEAREELSVPKIFSPDYWAPDGNWSYDVEPDGDSDQVLFPDVAKAHPLIRKWTAIVDEQVMLWKIDRSMLDGEDGDARMEAAADDAITSGTSTIPLPPPASRQPLDW